MLYIEYPYFAYLHRLAMETTDNGIVMNKTGTVDTTEYTARKRLVLFHYKEIVCIRMTQSFYIESFFRITQISI